MSRRNSIVSQLLIEFFIPEGDAEHHIEYFKEYARKEFLRLLKWSGVMEEPDSYLVEVQKDLFSRSVSLRCSAYTAPSAFNRKIIFGGPNDSLGERC